MVVEVLRFEVDPSDFDEWVDVDRRTWTAFLEQQRGFLRKEVWRGPGDEVRVVVWWRTRDDWDAITDQQVAEVDARMGEWFRASTLETFDVS